MRQIINIVAICAFLCVGCAIQKPIVAEKVNSSLLGSEIQLSDSIAAIDWKDVFVDPYLQRLISEAMIQNADIRIMQFSLDQAAVQLKTAKLSYLPSFALNPGGSLGKIGNSPLSKAYEVPLTMQWELNLAGGAKAQKDVSKYSWMQTSERLRYLQIQMASSIANAYCTLLMLDEQLRLTREHLTVQEETLRVMRTLKEVGRANELAVSQTEATYRETVSSMKDLELNVLKVEQTLNLLLGRTPGHIERSSMAEMSYIAMDESQPVSLEMLASRPDVKEAEYALRSSFSNVLVARSRFYPSLSINANGNWTNDIGEIVSPAQIMLKLIGSLVQPLFMHGQIKGQVDIAKSQQAQAQVTFEQALLQAGGEVREALAECRSAREKKESRDLQVEASSRAFEHSQLLMKYSSGNYLEVLTAQTAYLNAQLQATADWFETQQGAINLFKALCPVVTMQSECM